jgi:hypothetical protein
MGKEQTSSLPKPTLGSTLGQEGQSNFETPKQPPLEFLRLQTKFPGPSPLTLLQYPTPQTSYSKSQRKPLAFKVTSYITIHFHVHTLPFRSLQPLNSPNPSILSTLTILLTPAPHHTHNASAALRPSAPLHQQALYRPFKLCPKPLPYTTSLHSIDPPTALHRRVTTTHTVQQATALHRLLPSTDATPHTAHQATSPRR